MSIINPRWVEYNNTYNEGGEGYNPHPKYISQATHSTARQPGAARMIRGKMRTEAAARKFARDCLSGEQRRSFEAEIDAAFAA